MFWRSWFKLDRVHLHESRRDYLEYRFGTIASINDRNGKLGWIPYYVWIGCQRTATCGAAGALAREAAEHIDALATESPYLSPVHYTEKRTEAADAAERETRLQLRSKGFEAAVLNLATNVPLPSFFYQNQRWRLYYDESLQKHRQFNNEYIYAFTWEDPAEDQRLLNIGRDDVVFAITSAGDNVLSYALHRPRSIHAVDLNPTQNHLLELKVAAFSSLPYADVWKLFGEGRHAGFRDLLLDRLSPWLSSRALQYWLDSTATFTARGGLYETGGSRIAVKLAKWLFRGLGLGGAVRRLCAAATLDEQRAVWRGTLRPVVLSRLLSYAVVADSRFLWRALGVPENQRAMIADDGVARAVAEGRGVSDKEAMWQYVVDTLDPVVENTLLKDSNYFYRLCLQGRYSKEWVGCLFGVWSTALTALLRVGVVRRTSRRRRTRRSRSPGRSTACVSTRMSSSRCLHGSSPRLSPSLWYVPSLFPFPSRPARADPPHRSWTTWTGSSPRAHKRRRRSGR